MSYLALARKWRPKNFADTVGQEHVLRALSNALESGRLHHAYLFAGTRGVGKTTIARILAKALNCDVGVSAEPCGECSACNEIDEGRFVDLIEVDAASRTKVDDTRDLLDNVQYAPARGRFKVYLIDEVHMLSKSSFNALLKTLEEPPPHVKFLLATTDPQKIPVTVLSRCLQFILKRLTPGLIQDRLQLICDEEKIKADSGALTQLARAADGSLRDALSLLDQAIAYCGGDVRADSVGVMLGTIDSQYVQRLLGLLADGDAAGIMQAMSEIDEQFPDYARLLEDLARALQQVAISQVVGTVANDNVLNSADVDVLAAKLAPEDVQLFYQTALIGRRDLNLAPDPRGGAEMTLLRMLAFVPAGSRQRPEIRKSSGASPGVSPIAKLNPSTEQLPVVETMQLRSGAKAVWADPNWAELVKILPLVGVDKMLAKNCAFLRREENIVYLALDSRSKSYLTTPRKDAVAAALSEHFDEKLRIEITLDDCAADTPVQAEERRENEKRAAAATSLEADPNVKAMQEMFGAELNHDSIELIHNQNAATQERDV